MDKDEQIKTKVETMLVVLATLILCGLTLFFIYIYYTHTNEKSMAVSTEELLENEDLSIPFAVSGSREEEIEKINTNYLKTSELSLEDVNKNSLNEEIELKTIKANLGGVSLNPNFINEKLTDDFVESERNVILSYLRSGHILLAIERAKEIESNYDFKTKEYVDFEVFLYEVINTLKGYENKTYDEKIQVLQHTLSPEIIYFIYLDLPFDVRNSITENRYSEFIPRSEENKESGYLGSEDAGLYEEMDVTTVYFVSSNLEGHRIMFNLGGIRYNLYYVKHTDTGIISIIKIDDTSGKTTTLKDIQDEYEN